MTDRQTIERLETEVRQLEGQVATLKEMIETMYIYRVDDASELRARIRMAYGIAVKMK
jgi:hypothetical protein